MKPLLILPLTFSFIVIPTPFVKAEGHSSKVHPQRSARVAEHAKQRTDTVKKCSEQTLDPGVNARQEIQKDRIKQGVKSGELTKKETYTLAQKEARFAKFEKRLKEDSSLSAEERAKLQKYLKILSADIHQQKHDEEDHEKTD